MFKDTSNPSIDILVGLLEEEIKSWNEAAQHCEAALPLLSGKAEEMDWLVTSLTYRERAENLQLILDQVSGNAENLFRLPC